MKVDSRKLTGDFSFLAGVTILLAFLAACGGSASEATPVPTEVRNTPTAIVQNTPTAAPTAIATATVAPTPVTSDGNGSPDADLLAQGKLIFEETAGGVGCAYCHGMDGKGNGPSGLGAPPNRGATRDRLEWALAGGETDAMTFIRLSNAEINAVLAYLQYLNEQP